MLQTVWLFYEDLQIVLVDFARVTSFHNYWDIVLFGVADCRIIYKVLHYFIRIYTYIYLVLQTVSLIYKDLHNYPTIFVVLVLNQIKT